MRDILTIVFCGFATLGVLLSGIHIANAISKAIAKRKAEREKADYKIEMLSKEIDEYLKAKKEFNERLNLLEGFETRIDICENNINRIDSSLDISLRDMDYRRIRNIEKRLDNMVNDIAKQIVRIDEIEGRLKALENENGWQYQGDGEYAERRPNG